MLHHLPFFVGWVLRYDGVLLLSPAKPRFIPFSPKGKTAVSSAVSIMGVFYYEACMAMGTPYLCIPKTSCIQLGLPSQLVLCFRCI